MPMNLAIDGVYLRTERARMFRKLEPRGNMGRNNCDFDGFRGLCDGLSLIESLPAVTLPAEPKHGGPLWNAPDAAMLN